MLHRLGESNELEFCIQSGEKNPTWTRDHLRRDCARSQITWWRARRRACHGHLPKRTRNSVASRRGRRRQVVAARAERIPAAEATRKRRLARRGKAHREFCRQGVAAPQEEAPGFI